MVNHPNLSPELNALVAKGNDPGQSLDLKTVKAGQVVTIIFDSPEVMMFSFEVTRPAGLDAFKDTARGRIVEIQLDEEMQGFFRKHGASLEIGEEVEVQAAVTWNPHAPIGATMIHGSHVTVGRELIWALGPMACAVCMKWPVMTIVTHDSRDDYKTTRSQNPDAE